MSTERDLKMARALESIPLPELPKDYYARLSERLAQERPAVRPTARRPRLLRVGLAAAAVAAAAAVVAFAVLPALRGGPETATAAEMLASMDAAAGGAHEVRLTIVEQRALHHIGSASSASPEATARSRPVTVREELTLSTAGDLRYADDRELVDGAGNLVRTRTVETYDARRHEMMRDGETHLVEGQPVPDPNPYGHQGPKDVIIERPTWGTTVFSTYLMANFQALSNSLRALLAEAEPSTPVSRTTYLGRPAWQADLREVMPAADGSTGVPAQWRVTVDEQTGLLMASDLRAVSARDKLPGIARSFRVTRFEVDPDLPADWQRIDTSSSDQASFDPGTRFGTPESVAARAWPTLVLVPAHIPHGYRLTDVATRDYRGMEGEHTHETRYVVLKHSRPRKYAYIRVGIDASKQRVQLRYRRGFSSFVISIKPLSGGAAASVKPDPAGAEDVVLTGGYLKGASASVWISPYFGEGPTLVTTTDRSRVTITGDLTRQELLDVADSITAVGDLDRPLPEGYGH
jgi:hypothetical protein